MVHSSPPQHPSSTAHDNPGLDPPPPSERSSLLVSSSSSSNNNNEPEPPSPRCRGHRGRRHARTLSATSAAFLENIWQVAGDVKDAVVDEFREVKDDLVEELQDAAATNTLYYATTMEDDEEEDKNDNADVIVNRDRKESNPTSRTNDDGEQTHSNGGVSGTTTASDTEAAVAHHNYYDDNYYDDNDQDDDYPVPPPILMVNSSEKYAFLDMGLARNLSILPGDVVHASQTLQQQQQQQQQRQAAEWQSSMTTTTTTTTTKPSHHVRRQSSPFHRYRHGFLPSSPPKQQQQSQQPQRPKQLHRRARTTSSPFAIFPDQVVMPQSPFLGGGGYHHHRRLVPSPRMSHQPFLTPMFPRPPPPPPPPPPVTTEEDGQELLSLVSDDNPNPNDPEENVPTIPPPPSSFLENNASSGTTIPISAYLLLLSAILSLSSIGPLLELQTGVNAILKVCWRASGTALLLFPMAVNAWWRQGQEQQQQQQQHSITTNTKVNDEMDNDKPNTNNNHNKIPPPPPPAVPPMTWLQRLMIPITALTYTTFVVCFSVSLNYTSVGNAVILGNSQSLLLLLGKLLLGTHVTTMESTGALIAFSGAVLCSKDSSESAAPSTVTSANDDASFSSSPYSTYMGDALALCSAIGGALYIVLAKRVRMHLNLYVFMFVNMIQTALYSALFAYWSTTGSGGGGSTATAVTLDRHVDHGIFGWVNPSRIGLELLIVVVCNVLGAMGYVRAMQYFDALVISVAALMEPVVAELMACLLGVGFLPGWKGWLGNALVIGGTFAVVYYKPSTTTGMTTTTTTKLTPKTKPQPYNSPTKHHKHQQQRVVQSPFRSPRTRTTPNATTSTNYHSVITDKNENQNQNNNQYKATTGECMEH